MPDRSSLAARIETEIRRRIIDGTYQAHGYLPSERRLAVEFRTSRVTISKALEGLERDGLVVRSPGRGTRVLPPLERLSRSLVGIVHGSNVTGELTATDSAHLQGSLRALQGIKDTLRRLGHRYESVSVRTPRQGERLYGVDGDDLWSRFGALVFLEKYVDDAIGVEIERRQTPFVVAKLEPDLDVAATYVDHREPTRQAVQTLVNLGHVRIAFVGREPSYGFYARARDGYVTGLREAGQPVDESLLVVCDKTDALSGYFAAKAVLEIPDPPTAIVAGRDAIAEGVCRAIEERGLQVGYHVSVIGFDHMTWPGGEGFLTTFHEPCYEMGVAAVEMLMARIVNPALPREKRKFETPFVLRRSAGPPPRDTTAAPTARQWTPTVAGRPG